MKTHILIVMASAVVLGCYQSEPLPDHPKSSPGYDVVTESTDVSLLSDTSMRASDIIVDVGPRSTEVLGSSRTAPDGEGSSASNSFTIGTWNLHNFSKYGTSEWRIDDIAAYIKTLNVDVLAVQELKVKEGTTGESPQAWDALLDQLPNYQGVHAKWDINDSTVGLIYKVKTVTLDSHTELFTSDWEAFPRQPLEAKLTIQTGATASTINVIVLHLKAFKDSVERRQKACKRLVQHIESKSDDHYLIIGDLNDDPYDSLSNNSYQGTFLNAEPDYFFVSKDLPKGTVTSTGYYTWVNGTKMDGEFLDHAIVTGAVFNAYKDISVEVQAVQPSEWAQWKKNYSDHFPLLVHFVSN